MVCPRQEFLHGWLTDGFHRPMIRVVQMGNPRCAGVRVVPVLAGGRCRITGIPSTSRAESTANRSCRHLALEKDAPVTRPVAPASAGRIVVSPQVGGLHHRYDRVAA
jgi:hypothetical protein